MKLDSLTSATVVDDAIRFVSAKTKDLKSFSEGDKDEPDYDEDKSHISNRRVRL
jgi:hypothetical protein